MRADDWLLLVMLTDDGFLKVLEWDVSVYIKDRMGKWQHWCCKFDKPLGEMLE